LWRNLIHPADLRNFSDSSDPGAPHTRHSPDFIAAGVSRERPGVPPGYGSARGRSVRIRSKFALQKMAITLKKMAVNFKLTVSFKIVRAAARQ
jgi:hypothetical protein